MDFYFFLVFQIKKIFFVIKIKIVEKIYDEGPQVKMYGMR